MPDYSDEQRDNDAATFIGLITSLKWQPKVWKDEGEIGIEWISAGKHAIVSIEGDGLFGYAMLRDGVFHSGEERDPPVTTLPADLRDYLEG
jgi:hypothetical protein